MMLKRLFNRSTIAIFALLVIVSAADAATYTRLRSVVNGGTSGAMDAIDGADLGDGDICFVINASVVYMYRLDATSGATESSPTIIAPDTNAGTKRWILVGAAPAYSQLTDLTDGGASTLHYHTADRARANHTGTQAASTISDFATAVGSATATLTNKTFNADGTGNSVTNIENADIKAGAAIDAAKIANGTVSSTEFQYLDGVTSAIQTQLNGKQGTLTNSAGLAGALSDETGSGAAVFGTSPTFMTGIGVGTAPASGVQGYFKEGTSGVPSFNANGNNLVVESSSATGMTFASPSAQASFILFSDPDATDAGSIDYWHTGDYMRFKTGAAMHLVIDGPGDVSLGPSATNPPLSTLHISESDQVNGAKLTIENAASSSSWTAGDTVGEIDFYTRDTSGAGSKANIKAVAELGTAYPGRVGLAFGTSSNNVLSEKMRLDYYGRLGLGTSTPGSPVHIVSSDARIRLQDDDDTTSYTDLDDANPNTFAIIKRSTTGSPVVAISPYAENGTGTQYISLFAGSNTAGETSFNIYQPNSTTRNHAFRGNDQDSFMCMSSAGTGLGIGTQTPYAKGHIVSATAFNAVPGDNTATLLLANSAETADSLNSVQGFLGFQPTGRTYGFAGIGGIPTAADRDQMGIVFYTHPSASNTDPMVEAMRINDEGQVLIGGTSPYSTEKLYIAGDAYLTGDLNADDVVDRTPHYEGDALAEIAKVTGQDGEIDHDSLPVFAQRSIVHIEQKITPGKRVPVPEEEAREIQEGEERGGVLAMDGGGAGNEAMSGSMGDQAVAEEHQQLKDGVKLDPETGEFYRQDDTVEEIRTAVPGRSLSAMVSVLTVAVQQLTERNNALEARVKELEVSR